MATCKTKEWIDHSPRRPQVNSHLDHNVESSGGAVVRALASHQCSPGSIPRLGVMCGLSLLVLYSALTGFPLCLKTDI